MIAALPMYDRAELHPAHDALWRAVRAELAALGVDAPERLTRGGDPRAQWRSPELLLGQTCGLPLRQGLYRDVTLVATLDYGLEDTPPGHYLSVFVARAGDTRGALEEFAGAALACNAAESHSGWHAAWETGLGFGPVRLTGAHRDSAAAVARGAAEIAAIDAVTWRGIARFEPEIADRLKVVGRSRTAPGLPLITARAELAAPLRAAVAAAVAGLEPGPRAALGLVGVVEIDLGAYLAVPIPPPPQAEGAESA